MPAFLTCVHCQIEFKTTKQRAREGQKYCSSTCYRAREKLHGPRKLVEPIKFVCQECHSPFERNPGELLSYQKKFGHDPLYCSTECGGLGRRKHKERLCKNCSKPLKFDELDYSRRRVTCSAQCRRELHSKSMRAAYATKEIIARPARHGYLRISVPDSNGGRAKEYLEHRYVMEQFLGRAMLPGETVHHKNGVRSDNRLENLELFTGRHGPGQRVKDQIAWAIEMAQLYPEFLRDAGYKLVPIEDQP